MGEGWREWRGDPEETGDGECWRGVGAERDGTMGFLGMHTSGFHGNMCIHTSVQLPDVHTNSCDNISQFSVDSITSLESKEPVFIAAGDIRYARTHSLTHHTHRHTHSLIIRTHSLTHSSYAHTLTHSP